MNKITIVMTIERRGRLCKKPTKFPEISHKTPAFTESEITPRLTGMKRVPSSIAWTEILKVQ